jgi:hypothetical protein
MFLGHFAVGFAGKKFAPQTSLGALIAAALLPDMLWPVFLLLGWEEVRIDPGNTRFTPLGLVNLSWSHSLLMTFVWASGFAWLYCFVARYRRGAVVVWIAAMSHWVLDWISHRPDMPLYPGGPGYGLGLWNSIAGTLVVELTLFGVGVWMYVGTTRSKDRIGRYGLISYVVVLLVIYVGDRFSALPASAGEIAWTGLTAEAIVIPWAWWFDGHRVVLDGAG